MIRIVVCLMTLLAGVLHAVSGVAGDGPCCSGGELVVRTIQAPPAGFWTARGRIGDVVSFASGERLEVWWTGFFPRYELRYFRSATDRGETIGRCHFSQGCNKAFYVAPAATERGLAPCLAGVIWESYDYGYDGGVPGYLDRYVHTADLCSGRYTVMYDLLFYACEPPLGHYPDYCDGTCDPPYRTETVDGKPAAKIFKRKIVEERNLERD